MQNALDLYFQFIQNAKLCGQKPLNCRTPVFLSHYYVKKRGEDIHIKGKIKTNNKLSKCPFMAQCTKYLTN